MSEMKTKLRQLKYKMKHDFLTVENVILVVAVALCLFWTYQSIVSMSRNWELSEKLTEKRRELALLEIEAEMEELENEYYASDEYQELLARRLLDKQLEGENMVVLPENSEAAKTKHQEETETEEETTESSNVEKWLKYLFPEY